MPRFRIQSNLHLDGFQMLDACLENVTSFEGLDDRNTGRIVFLNGSSSNKSNLHPAVFYGNEFKGLAYLDDIDKITNGEGSLGTRVKALEDMLNVDSAETVVSTWEEIQAFLDNVKEGTDLMTMLDDKLSKSKGGTIESPIVVNCEYNYAITNNARGYWTGIRYRIADTTKGYLGINEEEKPIHVDAKQSQINFLLHSGNVGEYTAGAANRLANKVSLWGNEFDGTQNLSKHLYLDSGNYIVWMIGDASVTNLVTGNTGNFIIGNGGALLGYKTYLDGGTLYFRTAKEGVITTAMTITDEGNVEVAGANNAYTRKLAVGIGSAHIVATVTGLPSLDKLETNSLLVGSVHYGLQIGTDTNDEASFIQAQRFNSADAKTLNLNPLGGAVNVGEGGLNVAGHVNFNSNGDGIGIAGRHIYLHSNGIYDTFDTVEFAPEYTAFRTRLSPAASNSYSLGFSSYRWSNVYSVGGDFSGRVLIGGAVDDGSTALQVKGDIKLESVAAIETYVSSESNGYLGLLSTGNEMIIEGKTNSDININYRRSKRGYAPKTWNWQAGSSTEYADFVLGHATFNGGAYIPSGQKLTIGDATIEYDSIAKAIKVDGNLFTTGTNASGGKADAQQGGTGGNAEVYRHDLDWGEQVYEIQNVKGDVNVNVQVYEWNENGNSWDMILTDVSVTANIITVTFGRPTSVDHMVTVV